MPAATYERLRARLDAALRLPSTAAETAVSPAEQSIRDSAGNVYVSTWAAFVERQTVAPIVAEALASGEVTEVTADEYDAVYVRMAPGVPRGAMP